MVANPEHDLETKLLQTDGCCQRTLGCPLWMEWWIERVIPKQTHLPLGHLLSSAATLKTGECRHLYRWKFRTALKKLSPIRQRSSAEKNKAILPFRSLAILNKLKKLGSGEHSGEGEEIKQKLRNTISKKGFTRWEQIWPKLQSSPNPR